jgi:Transketolase, C-terminal subunit
MRNTFAKTFYEAAKTDDKLCVLVADISPAGSIAQFRDEFPDRFINTGIAEQIMIGMAAGMAMRGMKPFAYTIAPFALFRPYEFVRDDLCYQNQPVTVVGIGGGVTYSTLGATHQALEDVALASTLPNMQVIAPCDPEEVRAATLWCVGQTNGPVYMRLAKAGEPVLTEGAETWRFGKLRYVRRGQDVCILTYGPILKMALQVADRLQAAGRSVSVVSAHTLKPFDADGLREAMARHKHVIVIEELLPNGGLAGWAKQIAWDAGAACRLDTFTLKDAFLHVYGSHDQLLAAHGLSVEAIMARIG